MESRKTFFRFRLSYLSLVLILLSSEVMAQNGKQLVRLARIEVDSAQLNDYNEFLREEIEASISREPGVITLYGIAGKEHPTRITLFETYADSSQYKAHLATPHFQKYKQGTLKMVTKLELVEVSPLLYHRKASLSKAKPEELFIRLIEIEIDSGRLEDFNDLATKIMMPGIKDERGVLVMYAVAEKKRPTQINILEVYKNLEAYNDHIKTAHFLEYKEKLGQAVKTLKFTEVIPILLGSKPQ